MGMEGLKGRVHISGQGSGAGMTSICSAMVWATPHTRFHIYKTRQRPVAALLHVGVITVSKTV